MRHFGLDGEMSAASLADGGRLIQIGFAAHESPGGAETSSPATFSMLINPGAHHWDARAAAVHGFSPEEVASAPTAPDVDEACVQWLAAQGITRERSAIAIGFNVGAFDVPHLAAVLPRTALLFARRTIDLNALCFTLAGKEHDGNTPTWSGWKRMASTYAERVIAASGASDEVAHDAGYDALLHLHAWRFLRAAAHGAPLLMPQESADSYSSQVQRATGALLAQVGMAEAVRRTGYSAEQLKAWANRGRITDAQVLPILRAVLAEAVSP